MQGVRAQGVSVYKGHGGVDESNPGNASQLGDSQFATPPIRRPGLNSRRFIGPVRRLALRKGMQEADAEDVAQVVLAAAAETFGRRGHDLKRAKFRTWLYRVSLNAIRIAKLSTVLRVSTLRPRRPVRRSKAYD